MVSLLECLFEPFGLDTKQISAIGGGALITGIVVAPIVAHFIGTSKKYLGVLRVLSFVMAASFGCAIFFIQQNLKGLNIGFIIAIVILSMC